MRYVTCGVLALLCVGLGAQTSPTKVQFEVASVKPAMTAESGGRGMPPMMREMMRSSRVAGFITMPDPGRIHLPDWTLLDLVAAAYRVRADQVSGPAWMGTESFDIDAKLPEGARKEDVNAMLQALLEERFGLKVHRETQTKQGFALVVGKGGPKLKPAEEPAPKAEGLTDDEQRAQNKEKAQANLAAIMQRAQDLRHDSTTPLGGLNTMSWNSTTMPEMAGRLVRFTDAPVVDETGLTGKYSVHIEIWKNGDLPGGTIFDAVEKLGLKLEPRKVSAETIFVDAAAKTPTAN